MILGRTSDDLLAILIYLYVSGRPISGITYFQPKLKSSEGGVRTRDLTIMSRALSPTELPRLAAQRREPSSVKRAPAENRTLDLLLTMETLCRLSYRGNESLVYRILPLVTN